MPAITSKDPQSKDKKSPAIITDNGSDRPPSASEGTIFIENDGDNNVWQYKGGRWEMKGGGTQVTAGTGLPNVYNAADFGLVPGVDCSPLFENLKTKFGKDYPFELRFGVGTYMFSKPLVLESMAIKIVGVYSYGWGPNTTIFRFADDGIFFRGCNGARMKDVRVYGSDKGRGIMVSSVMQMENVVVTHFNKGVEIWGELYNGNQLDASRCRFESLTISVCKEFGLRIIGGDSNQSSFYDLDIRDIEGIGLLEESFLGNSFYTPHFNNCKGGALKVTNPNSVVSFYDCYMEQGMPPSMVTKNTAFYGDRNYGVPIQGGYVQRGTTSNELIIGNIMLQDGGIKLFNKGGSNWNFHPVADGVWQLDFANLDATKTYFIAPDKEFNGVKGPVLLRAWSPSNKNKVDLFP